ncbi:hypothetical protein ACS0TY_021568 [Phlomoides rotata]
MPTTMGTRQSRLVVQGGYMKHMSGCVVTNGFWGLDRITCCIINMYAPCSSSEKTDLWDPSCICVIGDLNSISRESEREDRGLTSNHREIVAFQSFINDNGLVDLPLHGRRFSWYKSNGSCKSRIDRALLNSHWIHRWPNSGLRGLRRSISDHCPIMLEINSKDWGSKQFLCLNAWFVHSGFINFVSKKWKEYDLHGWGSFILKEKFKQLKAYLNEIRNLNTIDEVFGLQEHEIIKINESLALLLRELNMKSTLNYQKARCSWIKEGDCNSRFFHNYINMKRRRNNILGLQVNGEWVEEVLEVKKGVFDHFHSHFKRDSCVRPLLASDFTDKKLS